MTAFLKLLSILLLTISIQLVAAQSKKIFTHDDTLRGSITPQRVWWDVQRYSIEITPDFMQKSIQGKNTITYKVLNKNSNKIQIDLQAPMIIDSAICNNQSLSFNKKSANAWIIKMPENQIVHELYEITVYYHGIPHEALRAPWDGGWVWQKDSLGRIWSTVACEGIGASIWYPCKDHWSDEPDMGAMIAVTVPDTLMMVGNGQLTYTSVGKQPHTTTYAWSVQCPINNYNIIPYIGKYVLLSDTLQGEKGTLPLSYWVIDFNKERASKHFTQTKKMFRAFEYWFGPYPFYEDGYKLVESPHLGMEHQSAIAYGNKYINGYRGRDLSGTGWGLDWDFIIVHESGHEWFGNNITAKDLADMWIHESFTNYSETLFVEYYYGKEAANDYCYGIRNNIKNDEPIVAHFNVNEEGSGDMYYKGGNMLHSIRHAMDDDNKFRNMLRGLNKEFYHQTVTGKQIQQYINNYSGIDFNKVFQQYLTTTQIPELEYKISAKGDIVEYRWTKCVKGFNMPLTIRKGEQVLHIAPSEQWQKTTITTQQKELINPQLLERLYYITTHVK